MFIRICISNRQMYPKLLPIQLNIVRIQSFNGTLLINTVPAEPALNTVEVYLYCTPNTITFFSYKNKNSYNNSNYTVCSVTN